MWDGDDADLAFGFGECSFDWASQLRSSSAVLASGRTRSMLLCLLSIGAPWQKLGPKNIGDDAQGQGYAGTIADAVSPLSNPDLIYAGGHNLS